MQTDTTKTNGHTKQARPELVMLELDAIEPHPNQPRKTFTEIDELAQSILEHGQLEPIMVRPSASSLGGKGRYQLVFGERRWRACRQAKVPTVLALVRDLDDRKCEEIMVVENTKRSDLHPLEEAEGYERLHKVHGLSVDELAAKVNKSAAQIYARMKLCALCKKARDAFYAGKIDASKALLLARIPREDLQVEALKAIADERAVYFEDRGVDVGDDDRSDGRIKDVPSYRESVAIVQSRFMLRLVDAPFDRADATLVGKAGACTTCPKRTGNQAELFADVKSADVCTDPTCFRGKLDAHWGRLKTSAIEKGQKVIEDKAAAKLFSGYDGGLEYSAPYIDLDAKTWSKGKSVKVRDTRKTKEDTIILARDKEGRIHELVKKPGAADDTKGNRDRYKELEKKRQERQQKRDAKLSIEERKRELVVSALVEKAEGKTPAIGFWRALAFHVMRDAESTYEVLKGRKLIGSSAFHVDRKKEEAIVSKLSEKTLRGLIVEIIASDGGLYNTVGGQREAYDLLCELYKVDPDKFEAEAKASVGTGK